MNLGPGEIVQGNLRGRRIRARQSYRRELSPVILQAGACAGHSVTKETAVGETQFTEPEILWN